MIGENELFDIEIKNLQLDIKILAFFDLIAKSPFHLQFDKFSIRLKKYFTKISKEPNNQSEKKISFHYWIFQKVVFFLTPLFIRKFSFNLNDIQIEATKLNGIIKIKNITELFKISQNYVRNELQILSVSISYKDNTLSYIPEVRLSLNSDINILKILMVTAIKRLYFSIEQLIIQFSKGLSTLTFQNVNFFMSNDHQVKCYIEIKPIKIILPVISIDFQHSSFCFKNIRGNLLRIQCSEITAVNRDKIFLQIQKLLYFSRNLNVPLIKIELPYPFMLTMASFIQIIYINEPKLPKKFVFPVDVNCDDLQFKIDISDYHKIDMNFQKGFKIVSTIENNSIEPNSDQDLCAKIFVPKGACKTFDRDSNTYRILMKFSKGQVDIVNSKYYKIFAKNYDFYFSPMFVYMPYFRIIGKCFSHLMSIVKGPNFVQFEDFPPTLVHFIFNFKNFRMIFMKNELTAKIEQANDAKMSTINEMQLRLQKFFSIMKNNQVKKINHEEVEKTYNEIRFKLFREALRKIHDHDEDNKNEKFATFVMKNVVLDIDGFHFKSKKSIIENLTQNEKYESLKLTKESIGKINSMKLVIDMDTFDIFSNINSQFAQYEICKMKKIHYGIEFHFLDKKPTSHRDYFLNELTLDGEKFIIPILSSEPLLIYDKLVFTFDRFKFDFIPAFVSYYNDSMIMISKIFCKLVPYPKIALFDNLRMRNVIYGFMRFDKMKLHIMPKPKSSLATITFFSLTWGFVNPFNHTLSFDRFLVKLKNKELFMSFPSLFMDAKLKITNKNFEKENQVVVSPFVEVDSVKMLEIGYDPYEMSRSQQIDFTVDMKFPKLEESMKSKQTKMNLPNHDKFIELNFDYLSIVIDKFIIKRKFAFEIVNNLFIKSVKKRNPIIQNYTFISPIFPSTNIHYNNYTINVNLSNLHFIKNEKENDFKFNSLEFWFLRMKDLHTGTLTITDFRGINYAKEREDLSHYKIKNFRFEIYDKFLIHFFLKLASMVRSVLNNSAGNDSTGYHSHNRNYTLLSLSTKEEEEKRQKRLQKAIKDQKCTRLDPETSLHDLLLIFEKINLIVLLETATVEFYHRSFSVSPSISFKQLSLEGRRSSKLKGGSFEIIKFEKFNSEILQKKGFPFIQAKEMEFYILLSSDRLFFMAQLKEGMNMNIQSDAISLTTDELFSNLPKIEQIFSDENFINFINQKQKEKDNKMKDIEKKKKKQIDLYDSTFIYSNDKLNLIGDKENDNDDDEESENDDENINKSIDFDAPPTFARQFSVSISSNIVINLIDSGFNSIATLKSNKISYTYIFRDGMSETQNIIVGNLEVFNNTSSAKDKTTGELNRYYRFIKPYEKPDSNGFVENKFLEMTINKKLDLMKLPFFNRVTVKIKPVEVNISRDFIKVLATNFQLFSKFNVFDFDKMKKYIGKMKQKSKSGADQDEEHEEESVSVAAAAAVSANPDENPYGFYGKVEVENMKLKMSIVWNDNATLFKSLENRALNIDKIVVTDLFATKERILKLVKKKITLDIIKSLPTLFISEKDRK